MDEEQLLLDKLGRSDVNALDTLYVRYAPKVYDFALRFLKNEAEAQSRKLSGRSAHRACRGR